MARVNELPGWPPLNYGGFRSAKGGENPTHANQVTIEDVQGVIGDHVNFSCGFDGKIVPNVFYAPDAKTAGKLETILKDNKGKILLSIGTLEIPQD